MFAASQVSAESRNAAEHADIPAGPRLHPHIPPLSVYSASHQYQFPLQINTVALFTLEYLYSHFITRTGIHAQ